MKYVSKLRIGLPITRKGVLSTYSWSILVQQSAISANNKSNPCYSYNPYHLRLRINRESVIEKIALCWFMNTATPAVWDLLVLS